jgi:hypothetical protein
MGLKLTVKGVKMQGIRNDLALIHDIQYFFEFFAIPEVDFRI